MYLEPPRDEDGCVVLFTRGRAEGGIKEGERERRKGK
jgi:hypothetical protein